LSSPTLAIRKKLALACQPLYMERLMDHGGLVGTRIPGTGDMALG